MYLILSFLLLVTPAAFSQAKLDNVVDQGVARNKQAIAGQIKTDKLKGQTNVIVADYKAVLKVNQDLRVYNEQLRKQIISQREEKEAIHESLERSGFIERQIVPLMFKMIDALENFIKIDLPFSHDLRLQQVAEIRELLDRGDVEINEKFRKVSELYQLESSYGRNIEAYREKISFEDRELEVNVLRVGRISLSFQTDSGDTTASWNRKNNQWEEISSFTYKSAITKGIKVARKQVSPDFIVVPIQKNEVE